jgi:hypothetical protein
LKQRQLAGTPTAAKIKATTAAEAVIFGKENGFGYF